MLVQLLTLMSHLLFIAFVHRLLGDVIRWDQFLKLTPETTKKVQLVHLVISIAFGFLVSSFFLSILQFSQTLRTFFM